MTCKNLYSRVTRTIPYSHSGLLQQLWNNWYINAFSLSQYIDLAGIDFLHWADPQMSYYSQRLKARQYLDLDLTHTSILSVSSILALQSVTKIHRHTSISHTKTAIPWLDWLDLHPSMPIWAWSYLIKMTLNHLHLSSYISCMVHFLGRADSMIESSPLFRSWNRTCW